MPNKSTEITYPTQVQNGWYGKGTNFFVSKEMFQKIISSYDVLSPETYRRQRRIVIKDISPPYMYCSQGRISSWTYCCQRCIVTREISSPWMYRRHISIASVDVSSPRMCHRLRCFVIKDVSSPLAMPN